VTDRERPRERDLATDAADGRVDDVGLLRPVAAERLAQAPLFRDVFGNPFHPLQLDPTLLTPTILSLAQAAYDERLMPQGQLDPQRLAVLASPLAPARAAFASAPGVGPE